MSVELNWAKFRSVTGNDFRNGHRCPPEEGAGAKHVPVAVWGVLLFQCTSAAIARGRTVPPLAIAALVHWNKAPFKPKWPQLLYPLVTRLVHCWVFLAHFFGQTVSQLSNHYTEGKTACGHNTE